MKKYKLLLEDICMVIIVLFIAIFVVIRINAHEDEYHINSDKRAELESDTALIKEKQEDIYDEYYNLNKKIDELNKEIEELRSELNEN
jgi:peptidoglycan hydrolase CwlO-like protein